MSNIRNLTNSNPNGLEQMFILISQIAKPLNYKELWEGLKSLDGHRKFKPFSVAPELEYKTLRECMETLEALSTQGTLRRMLEHKRRERPWEFK